MARTALSALGEGALGLLSADRDHIWAGVDLEVDFEAHEQDLRLGLSTPPGARRDERLELALGEEGLLLEDEPYADWALRRREGLEMLRQEARLALARAPRQGLRAFGAHRRRTSLASLLLARPHIRGGSECPPAGLHRSRPPRLGPRHLPTLP